MHGMLELPVRTLSLRQVAEIRRANVRVAGIDGGCRVEKMEEMEIETNNKISRPLLSAG